MIFCQNVVLLVLKESKYCQAYLLDFNINIHHFDITPRDRYLDHLNARRNLPHKFISTLTRLHFYVTTHQEIYMLPFLRFKRYAFVFYFVKQMTYTLLMKIHKNLVSTWKIFEMIRLLKEKGKSIVFSVTKLHLIEIISNIECDNSIS